MSFVSKIAATIASLIVGITGLLVLTLGSANAVADTDWNRPGSTVKVTDTDWNGTGSTNAVSDCDWNTPC